MKRIMIIVAVALFLSGCYWDNVETLFPDSGGCDTRDVSFSEDIIPILRNDCFNCHSNANSAAFAGGLSLEDYEDVAANSNRVIGSVRYDDGYIPMPPGNEKLDSCQIETIEAWINQGSPDN